jgi:hypothetical protein
MGHGKLISAMAGIGAWLIGASLSILHGPQLLGWVFFALGSGCFITAGLWWVHGSFQSPGTATPTAERELEELISYLKKEQENTAPWIGGLAGSDYQDVRAEMDAWAVAISRRLRKYDQELARVFNEDERRYTSLELQAFLDRRLQQLRRVITVLERRRDSA